MLTPLSLDIRRNRVDALEDSAHMMSAVRNAESLLAITGKRRFLVIRRDAFLSGDAAHFEPQEPEFVDARRRDLKMAQEVLALKRSGSGW